MRLPVTLSINRSITLLLWLLAACALAGAGLLATDLPLWFKLAGLAFGVALAAWLKRQSPVLALVLKKDGALGLIGRDGSETIGAVDPSTTVFPWLIVLRVRTSLGLLSLTCPRDALGKDGHRQLRLWLRQKASVAVQE